MTYNPKFNEYGNNVEVEVEGIQGHEGTVCLARIYNRSDKELKIFVDDLEGWYSDPITVDPNSFVVLPRTDEGRSILDSIKNGDFKAVYEDAKEADRLEKIEEVLEEMGIKYSIKEKEALVEFWTDTAGQDIPTEFEFDGTAEDFVKQFTELAEGYDVDENVEMWVSMRGKDSVPDTVRELMDDCQEAKDTLMEIAKKLQRAIDPNAEDEEEWIIKISYSWGEEEPDIRGFKSLLDAYKEALSLAAAEVYAFGTDHDETNNGCEISAGYEEEEASVDLHYMYDDTHCYYKVVKW